MSEFDPTAATGGRSEGSRARTTGELERGAAGAIGPILERTMPELGLGPSRAQMLRREIAEASLTGRAEGISLPPTRPTARSRPRASPSP